MKPDEKQLDGMTGDISEITQLAERDVSFPRSVTMPLLLYRLCKKYNISVSDATKEGALLLLRLNDEFIESSESMELLYKAAPSKFKEKTQRFIDVINKLNAP
jgi:hypothetical protein